LNSTCVFAIHVLTVTLSDCSKYSLCSTMEVCHSTRFVTDNVSLHSNYSMFQPLMFILREIILSWMKNSRIQRGQHEYYTLYL